jgi:hydrogenase maturation protease
MAGGAARVLVIGVGNPDRGDDGVGRAVAKLVEAMSLPGVAVAHMNGEIAALIERMADESIVYLIDACQSGALPGKVRRIDAVRETLPPESLAASTHGLGLAQAVELARTLGQLPQTCILYAIEGAQFEVGAALSPVVERVCAEVAGRLRDELAAIPMAKGMKHA